ncbi:hypothetical protein FHG61_00570, partial [Xylella fastidiosa subsp. multiplex]|nr:hypothetical protein [Xylella fastidiosa subsp. multiplex]
MRGVIHQVLQCLRLEPRGGAGDLGDFQQFLDAGGEQFPDQVRRLGMHHVSGVVGGFADLCDVSFILIRRRHLQGHRRCALPITKNAVGEHRGFFLFTIRQISQRGGVHGQHQNIADAGGGLGGQQVIFQGVLPLALVSDDLVQFVLVQHAVGVVVGEREFCNGVLAEFSVRPARMGLAQCFGAFFHQGIV